MRVLLALLLIAAASAAGRPPSPTPGAGGLKKPRPAPRPRPSQKPTPAAGGRKPGGAPGPSAYRPTPAPGKRNQTKPHKGKPAVALCSTKIMLSLLSLLNATCPALTKQWSSEGANGTATTAQYCACYAGAAISKKSQATLRKVKCALDPKDAGSVGNVTRQCVAAAPKPRPAPRPRPAPKPAPAPAAGIPMWAVASVAFSGSISSASFKQAVAQATNSSPGDVTVMTYEQSVEAPFSFSLDSKDKEAKDALIDPTNNKWRSQVKAGIQRGVASAYGAAGSDSKLTQKEYDALVSVDDPKISKRRLLAAGPGKKKATSVSSQYTVTQKKDFSKAAGALNSSALVSAVNSQISNSASCTKDAKQAHCTAAFPAKLVVVKKKPVTKIEYSIKSNAKNVVKVGEAVKDTKLLTKALAKAPGAQVYSLIASSSVKSEDPGSADNDTVGEPVAECGTLNCQISDVWDPSKPSFWGFAIVCSTMFLYCCVRLSLAKTRGSYKASAMVGQLPAGQKGGWTTREVEMQKVGARGSAVNLISRADSDRDMGGGRSYQRPSQRNSPTDHLQEDNGLGGKSRQGSGINRYTVSPHSGEGIKVRAGVNAPVGGGF